MASRSELPQEDDASSQGVFGSLVDGAERALQAEPLPGGLMVSRARERKRDPGVAARLVEVEDLATSGSLRQDWIQRLEILGDLPLDSRARRAAFPEMLDAFSLSGFRPVLAGEHCECRVADHAVMMAGRLYRGDQLVATWHREVLLDLGVVVHHFLKVELPFRRGGVTATLLDRGLELYDRLGLQQILLKTGLESGSYHWARCGFDFLTQEDRDRVVGFYNAVVRLLGLPLDTTNLTAASQYALAGSGEDEPVTVSFARIGSLLGMQAGRALREVAAKNGIDYYQQVPAGKAIMLAGPDWDGYLPLSGPARTALQAYIQSSLSRSQPLGGA